MEFIITVIPTAEGSDEIEAAQTGRTWEVARNIFLAECYSALSSGDGQRIVFLNEQPAPQRLIAKAEIGVLP